MIVAYLHKYRAKEQYITGSKQKNIFIKSLNKHYDR